MDNSNSINKKPLFHPEQFETTSRDLPSNPRTLNLIRQQREKILKTDDIEKLISPGLYFMTPEKANDTDELAETNTKYLFRNLYGDTLLTSLFFSRENIDNIQKLIRLAIYKEFNYVIDNQSNKELLVIMRALFLEYSAHPQLFKENMTEQEKADLYKKYTAEVNRLNKIVINDVVPRVASQLQQYLDYLRDASKINYQEEQPVNVSIKGQREYRSPTQVWFGGDF
jgi:hypothetical protein